MHREERLARAVRGFRSVLWLAVLVLLVLSTPALAGTWKTKASLPTPVFGAHVAAINGVLYVAGGTNNSGAVSLLQAFNPSKDKWTSLAAMPAPVYYGTAAVVNSNFML